MSPVFRGDRRFVSTLLFSLLTCAGLAGCTPPGKRVVFETNPPGADLFLSRVEGNVASEEVYIGQSPVERGLVFPTEEPDSVTYRVRGNKVLYNDAIINVEYEPKDQSVYRLDLVQNAVEVSLFEPQIVVSDQGVLLRVLPRRTLAYLEVIEKSPNVRTVVRISSNEDKNLYMHAPVASPTDDELIYSAIKVDQKAKPAYHEVKAGDTLDSIARKYQTSSQVIAVANGLVDKVLKVGTRIEIPQWTFYSNLWKQRVGSFAKTKLTVGNKLDLYPSYAPDGQYVFFSTNRFGSYPKICRIHAYKGVGIAKITHDQAEDFSSSVSGDGKIIAFASNRPGTSETQIWIVQIDGSLPMQVREGENPQISPDGQRLMFIRRNAQTNNRQIWVMNLDGTGETQLTQNTDFEVKDPRWSYDGRWIVFASNEGRDLSDHANFDIWLMDSEGSKKVQLTTNGSHDDKPCWDKDNKMIYFRSNRGGHWNLWQLQPLLPEE